MVFLFKHHSGLVFSAVTTTSLPELGYVVLALEKRRHALSSFLFFHQEIEITIYVNTYYLEVIRYDISTKKSRWRLRGQRDGTTLQCLRHDTILDWSKIQSTGYALQTQCVSNG